MLTFETAAVQGVSGIVEKLSVCFHTVEIVRGFARGIRGWNQRR